ncbi:Sec-independent protein translocase protein TatB [uncultured Sphingomonas sp.]|uniref:Sec-independent protein translocase protein TatB n=1 Tax=uncultured Sphingomonas sp. TaxID=158754 RepID=UPI0025E89C31|nr:Sec-independent protein translocase protein TatB [uncultured Sphingomonas sp.]
MFDVAPTELLLVAIVALLVIGPKDLPKAMRFVGHWVGKARGVARQFRSGFDSMVREAELAEMEKKWAEENARIMREHPMTPTPAALPAPEDTVDAHTPGQAPIFDHSPADPPAHDVDPAPVMVEKPVVEPAPADTPPPPADKAPS